MYRNGNGIAIAPEMEESRIRGGNIHPFHDFRLCDELLEPCNRKAIEFALLFLCLVFGACLASHFVVQVNDLALMAGSRILPKGKSKTGRKVPHL
jgi:hypothetical protein